jgi:hypothetical protein
VSWRGQGRRARGRRGDQDAEHDSTAWLEDLEKAAAEQDDEEEEWASKLRRRRSLASEPPRPTATEPPAPRAPDPPGRAPELPRAPVAHDLSPYPPLGGESAAPPPPPTRPPAAPAPTREPDYRLLGMEPDTRRPGGDWDPGWDTGNASRGNAATDWTAPDPAPSAPSAAGDPGTDWSTWSPPEGSGEPRRGAPVDWEGSGEPRRGAPVDWEGSGEPRRGAPVDWEGSGASFDWDGYDPGEPDWRTAGPDTWSSAEPVGREPDYPALFGELNRRSAAQREALWDSPPAPEPYEEPVSPEPPAPAWPFEENTGTWEPNDRSFIWPADELPTTSSEWEPSPPSWLDEPHAQPPTWSAAPAETMPPGPPSVAPGVVAAPDDWAAGIQSGVPPPARGLGEREVDAGTRRWRPEEAVGAEPAVPLGANGMPPSRSVADRVQMAEPEDNWELLDERPRSSWPRVVAVVSWIVLLMVVCWFYVFPWLEQVLPENF